MDKLVPAFKESVFDPHLGDVLGEAVESGIDSVLDEGVFRDIPFVSTVIGFAKTAQNIYDRNLLHQTAIFIQTFNAGSISSKKLQKYRTKIDSNPKYAEKELGRVLIQLNSNIDLEKSKFLAKFYRAYVEETISWEQFCELSDVNTRLFLNDVILFMDIYHGRIVDTSQCKNYQVERLNSLGLLDYAEKGFSYGSDTATPTIKNIAISELGHLFGSLL